MNFRLYPLASHECKFKVASYAWQSKDVRFVWKETDAVSIGNPLQTPSQYVLAKKHLDKKVDAFLTADAITTTGI